MTIRVAVRILAALEGKRMIWKRTLAALLGLSAFSMSNASDAEATRSGTKPGFRDCADCPEMLVVPRGRYWIGSAPDEPGRAEDEGPRRKILIADDFAMSRFEITLDQYLDFVKATGRTVAGHCITDRRQPFDWKPDADTNLLDPGYEQAGDHPVVCVNWYDAVAYARWLSDRTGKRYRLPRETEWEYAARGGTTTAYIWGDQQRGACGYMNGTDQTARRKYPAIQYMDCDDGALNTASVGRYRPNAFGLYDMTGNVGEWTESCATENYRNISSGNDATTDCTKRMVRGGSWGTIPRQQRVAERMRYAPDKRDDSIGIRLVRQLSHETPEHR